MCVKLSLVVVWLMLNVWCFSVVLISVFLLCVSDRLGVRGFGMGVLLVMLLLLSRIVCFIVWCRLWILLG